MLDERGKLGNSIQREFKGQQNRGKTGLRASERKSASERVSERTSEREGFSEIFERF